ncbi:MAG: permease-like cell division protein FtsX [Bacillaceae bacterium]
MKLKTAKRHIREGFKSLGRNGWMTFASASAVTVTLVLVGMFLAVLFNLNHFATIIENDVEIRVRIDLTATPEQEKQLGEEIKKLDTVSSVTYSPKEKELNSLISSFGEEGSAFSLYEQENPLNNVWVVKAKAPEYVDKIANEIEDYKYVASVVWGKEEVGKLFDVLSMARNIGIGLIVALLFTAMFLISNTIKITIFARRREIEIMRLVGATNSFIRWPFLIEGLLLGLLGSILPIALLFITYSSLSGYITPAVNPSMYQLLPFSPFVYQLSAVLAIIGMVIGMWGSAMSIRRFLKI